MRDWFSLFDKSVFKGRSHWRVLVIEAFPQIAPQAFIPLALFNDELFRTFTCCQACSNCVVLVLLSIIPTGLVSLIGCVVLVRLDE